MTAVRPSARACASASDICSERNFCVGLQRPLSGSAKTRSQRTSFSLTRSNHWGRKFLRGSSAKAASPKIPDFSTALTEQPSRSFSISFFISSNISGSRGRNFLGCWRYSVFRSGCRYQAIPKRFPFLIARSNPYFAKSPTSPTKRSCIGTSRRSGVFFRHANTALYTNV